MENSQIKSLAQYQVKDFGLIDYAQAYKIQKTAVFSVLQGGHCQVLLCEHPAVVTLGRLAKETNILVSRECLKQKDIKIYPVDRGGDVTLHSPGQLVVYPILNLNLYRRDLRWYLHKLEQVAIDLLDDFGIVSDRFQGRTGVFVNGKKIVSIGVGVKRWVSYHGLAINVNNDLELFSLIRPCGLEVGVASISAILSRMVDCKTLKNRLIGHFAHHFD